jgi:Alkylmercury lyase
MLIFRSEEHIDKWCKAWRLPRGATLSLEQTWKLAESWYRDRRAPAWRRRTVDEAHAIFHSLGLTSEFWRLA